MKFSFWSKSKLGIACIHAVAWLFILFLPMLFRYLVPNERRFPPREHFRPPGHYPSANEFMHAVGGAELLINLLWIGLFYINVYWLLPKFFFRRLYKRYAVSQLIVLTFMVSVMIIVFRIAIPNPRAGFPIPLITMTGLPFFFIQAVSITFYTVREKISSDQRKQEEENERLRSELSFLRSQVSPHFLFNVLNNMVGLARKKSDRLEPALIELSGLMRYMLYEADVAKVPLSKEIAYLRNYIELQKMRFGKEVSIITNFPDTPTISFIEPMILIPFVENAFKHLGSGQDKPFVHISIGYTGRTLQLSVTNSCVPNTVARKDRYSGIGLQNVQRRLTLLYPDKHQLTTLENGSTYQTKLSIEL